MELDDKKVILLRLENVLASFPIGKGSPNNCTDIRLNCKVVNRLRNMTELFRVVILYDRLDTINDNERLAMVKGVEFYLFCLLAVAVSSKSLEQRNAAWFGEFKTTLPKALSSSTKFLLVGTEDDKTTAHDLRIDYLTPKEFISYDKRKNK